jgi:serine/threonine protein kinase
MSIIKLTATDGSAIQFDDSKMAGAGGMKDVYFSPDRSYVVAWFRKQQDFNSIERLEKIVGQYREKIFDQPGGDYWNTLYRWPTKLVRDRERTAVIVPTYEKNFFFEFGSKNNDTLLGIRGKEKEGKWFASANHQQKHLDPQERGNWLNYLSICLKIARATRRMHAAGLAHSDLSYKNVLVDPRTGSACIIDIDGLVVPGKYPPDVLGTPDFIAPEVMKSLSLPLTDKNRALPRRETDQHALAVLIYMYLLYRHPLRGGKAHDMSDPQKDEELMMGEKALFIEHATDKSNRPNLKDLKPSSLPYADIAKLPYSLTGPYLKALFERAFIDGLHSPNLRPSADEWETALVKTVDLVQPCVNPTCDHKWFVFDNSLLPTCPFCSTAYKGLLPVLNLYSSDGKGNFRPENHRLMVYSSGTVGFSLYPWHVSRKIVPNEQLTSDQKKRVGYFSFYQGKWLLVNETLAGMKDVDLNNPIVPGTAIELKDGQKILLSPEDGGRLIHVQMVKS